jgi:aspartate/methionine/tyrosine aminotransferase
VLGLNVGEPDFLPPPEAMRAAVKAIESADVKYTSTTGTTHVPEIFSVAKICTLRYEKHTH